MEEKFVEKGSVENKSVEEVLDVRFGLGVNSECVG